ncbi:MAG: transglutaminase-like domain-containing protein [Flavobacteriaceae bacterium]|nr:transglutaminase-like domain-containing protein [Flavobacteriaceae bacterium]
MAFSKLIIFLVVISISFSSFSQKQIPEIFGKPSAKELAMSTYSLDPEASAVVLYEKGHNSFKIINNYIYLLKKVHRKIKVIDAQNFKGGQVDIYLYKSENSKDKITDLKAVTHNGNLQSFVAESSYYDIDQTKNWASKRFTFPNIKDRSVLEYEYTLQTQFFFNFGGWDFQGEYPKIYSEFVSEIPGNFIYRRALIGNEKLDVNDVSLKKDCFWVDGIANNADCEVATYAMKNVPAFKEEKHMLSKKNYIARINFEYQEYTNFKGYRTKYSRDWKDVDKVFRTDKDLGKQIKQKKYFESKIPANILSITNDLEKAKAIYTFIQEHYNWNGHTGVFSEARVKSAFEKGSGSSSEINLSLINALNAASLDAKIVLLSTRNQKLPNDKYPIITDFNYTLVFLSINETDYILDASGKYIPFGIIPYRALNLKGRVMDFKNSSYWIPIEPHNKNVDFINAQLIINDDESITGIVNETHTGYKAMYKREEINANSEKDYIHSKSNKLIDFEISEYAIIDKDDLNKPIKEKYKVNFIPEEIADQFFIYPYFLQNNFSENPFKLKERNYMVELGYPFSNIYMLTIDLNNKYEVVELPKNKKINLAGDAGECTVLYSHKNGKINLRFNFKLNEFRFHSEQYLDLKDFFNQVIEIQTKEAIVLKRI